MFDKFVGREVTDAPSSLPEGKPVIFISVSLGWAIRNFFQTGIVEKLKPHFEIVVLTTSKAGRSLCNLGYDQGIKILEIEVGQEPLLWKLFRQLKKKIYLEGRQSSTEAIWEKYQPRSFYQKIGGRVVKSFLKFGNAKRLYDRIDRLDLIINSDKRLVNIFKKYRPVMFFATHATAFFEECLLRNAIEANIPAVLMILSWDHLSSKILLNRSLHSIFVWNNHTKQEILQTYPCYCSEKIKVTGIPQYDLYATKPSITYADWCRKYDLDPARRTILFSTMPQSRHEQQHIIIEELLEAIVSRNKLPSDLQVLIKCHPFDNFKGYDVLLDRYPVGIHRNSFELTQNQEDWIPAPSEIEASRDTLYFCTLNINIFSTVTIEAAYFDKPVVHIAFDPQPVKNRIPCHEYYNWDHFKPIVDIGATILVHNYKEMFEAIKHSISQPELFADQRKMLLEKYIGRKVGTASTAVALEINKIGQDLKNSNKKSISPSDNILN